MLYIKQIFRAVLLIAIQVVILNRVNLMGYADPYLYVLFILLLPFETPKWALLLIGFSTGALVDIFSNSMGIHAAATTLLAFARPGVIHLISKKMEFEINAEPRIHDMGLRWFYRYAILLILIHHTTIFMLESFKIINLVAVAYRITFSAIITLVLAIVVQYLFPKRN